MDEQMRELTNDAVIDLVKEAGLDWHAGFNLDDENRYGTLVRLAFNLGAALSQPAAQGGNAASGLSDWQLRDMGIDPSKRHNQGSVWPFPKPKATP